MKLWTSLLLSGLCTQATQVLFNTDTTSTTLVDALSADPDYTTLLVLLQRARLIPTLNRLTSGCTFFAPVNSAWKTHPFWGHLALDDAPFGDNINEELRQQLFYHLVNYTLPTTPPPTQNPLVMETLHYPHKPLDPPTRLPPPYPPWLPVHNGTLGHDPQRLRLTFNNESARVGVDAFGNGGVQIIKGRVDAGNSTLMAVDGVLEPPPDLGQSPSPLALAIGLTHIICSLCNCPTNLGVVLQQDRVDTDPEIFERVIRTQRVSSSR